MDDVAVLGDVLAFADYRSRVCIRFATRVVGRHGVTAWRVRCVRMLDARNNRCCRCSAMAAKEKWVMRLALRLPPSLRGPMPRLALPMGVAGRPML